MNARLHENTLPCPTCAGSGRRPLDSVNSETQRYASEFGWFGYDPTDGKIDCDNCGSQYMFGRPTGKVRARPDGTPCLHQYSGTNIGNCLNKYVCIHCKDTHTIDSGD